MKVEHKTIKTANVILTKQEVASLLKQALTHDKVMDFKGVTQCSFWTEDEDAGRYGFQIVEEEKQ